MWTKNIYLSALFILILNQSLIAQNINHRDSVDVTHYQIKLDLSDLSSGQLKGETSLKITSQQTKLNSIGLDLMGLKVDKVELNKKSIAFNHQSSILRIDLQKAITFKDTIELKVYYHGKPQKDIRWGGFFITSTHAFNYGVGMAANPPNFGRVWYPCIDNFTDRATYEYIITTKNEHVAACPGILLSVKKNQDKTKTYHWKLQQTIPTYLSSIAVSDYKAHKDTVKGMEKIIPIEIYINKNEFEEGKKSFVHVKEFLHSFENAFGPYVWEKIGYVSTPFGGGAMEHATNIAYSANCNGSLRCESTLAHELSHHWFGDLVTCRTEKDMWLNEGWARYSEAIFTEYFYGKKAYKDYNRRNHKKVLQFAHLYDKGYRSVHGIPHEYTYGMTVYDKGADVAQTLRGYLGDSLFFSTLKQYFNDYAFKDISTEEFRDYFSQKTKIDLSDFFDFWVFGAGFPHFSHETFNVKKSGNRYQVDLKINQRLVASQNYLKTTLEIGFLDKNWQIRKLNIPFTGKSEIKSAKLDYKPIMLLIDPDEKIADATTDEYKIIRKTGQIKFIEEFFSLNVKHLTDSVFFRITHNWISPKNKNINKNEYKLANRYWQVQYVTKSSISASAKLNFDLSYALDDGLKNFSKENLRLMYRENQQANWKTLDLLAVKQGNKGYFMVEELKTGEYTIVGIK
ncbi:MAG: M1 family metallopeptidase [Bacteroidota bacterium]